MAEPLRIPGYPQLKTSETIVRLEGSSNYSCLYLTGQQRPLLVSKTLKHLELILPDFIRISKTCLLNPAYVQKVVRRSAVSMHLVLTDGTFLFVSRRRIVTVFNQLQSRS